MTVTLAVIGVPGQPLAVGVMVMATGAGCDDTLVGIPLMTLTTPVSPTPNTSDV